MPDYFILGDGELKGPYSGRQIKFLASKGCFKKTDKIKRNNGPWQSITRVQWIDPGCLAEDDSSPVVPTSLPEEAEGEPWIELEDLEWAMDKGVLVSSVLFFAFLALSVLVLLYYKYL